MGTAHQHSPLYFDDAPPSDHQEQAQKMNAAVRGVEVLDRYNMELLDPEVRRLNREIQEKDSLVSTLSRMIADGRGGMTLRKLQKVTEMERKALVSELAQRRKAVQA